MTFYTEPVTDLIRRRKSWRSYRREYITDDLKGQIQDFSASMDAPPFGSTVRFRLVDSSAPEKTRTPGTYGVIRGARHTLVGIVRPSPSVWEDFGYSFESVILFCTGLGLGTCWMGGTFSRDYYGRAVDLAPDEIIPAVSPVGYIAGKRSILDSLLVMGAGSRNRKPFTELFFRGDFSTSLDPAGAGAYGEALEMVRLAPSASNRQPWRVVITEEGVHFFLSRTPGYRKLFSRVDLQCIDMGIAMFHFASAASCLGISGGWRKWEQPPVIRMPEPLEYRVSWVPQL